MMSNIEITGVMMSNIEITGVMMSNIVSEIFFCET